MTSLFRFQKLNSVFGTNLLLYVCGQEIRSQGCRVMVSDQNRFRTKRPQLSTTQPASEVQLQPNGDCPFIRLFSFVLAARTSPLFGAIKRRAFLMELGDHCGSDDLYVNDERIPVSREVFQAVCKENNHILPIPADRFIMK